jgi:hypothetical protein
LYEVIWSITVFASLSKQQEQTKLKSKMEELGLQILIVVGDFLEQEYILNQT